MDKKIVNLYLNYINKFSSYFYFGIWKKTGFFKKYEFKSDNYHIPKDWELVFKKKIPSFRLIFGIFVIKLKNNFMKSIVQILRNFGLKDGIDIIFQKIRNKTYFKLNRKKNLV